MNNNNLDFKSYSPKISNCDSPKQKMSKLLSDFVVVDINNKINSKILYDNNITKNSISIIEENIYENKSSSPSPKSSSSPSTSPKCNKNINENKFIYKNKNNDSDTDSIPYILNSSFNNRSDADSISYILNKSFNNRSTINTDSMIFNNNNDNNNNNNDNNNNNNNNNINGWDNEANITIINWYHSFKKKKFIYQYIMDKNKNISNILHVLSILLSSSLGIFSAFKLSFSNKDYVTISDFILMFLNFINALITALSKKYIDEKRNEEIRKYILELDNFLGEIAAQVLKSLNYRINADEFFNINNDKYTKLITTAPNITLHEIQDARKKYKEYIKSNI